MKSNLVKRIVGFGLAVMMMMPFASADAFAAGGKAPEVSDEEIEIDGEFSDWEKIPETVISWDNQNGGIRVNHIGALSRDDDDLYVMFREDAEYKYYDTDKRVLQVHNMELRVGAQGVDPVLKVLPIDENGNRIGEPGDPMKDLKNGIHTRFGVFVFEKNGGLVQVGDDVCYTVSKDENGRRTQGDRIEFEIDLEELGEAWGIAPEKMATIEIKNHWLGEKVMSITGSSSYALTFMLIALPVVLLGYAGYAKNKKKSQSAE